MASKQVGRSYEQHPLALQLVPGTMPDEEFEAFCADISKRGQRVPAVEFEGKILDGWHRYKACRLLGIELETKPYDGDDAAGFVIALNVLRRKLGTTQRALAGAKLNLEYGISQDEASKRVGVSKVHINLVVQTLRSNNARLIKMLENPDLTRGQLHEELVDSGIVKSSNSPTSTSTISTAAATHGLDSLFANRRSDFDDEDDLLGDTPSDPDDVLGDALGAPPAAGGKVINMTKPSGEGAPAVGTKPTHPERRAKETPASALADRFRALTEADKITFMQMTWHIQRKLLSAAGLSVEAANVDAKQAAETVIARAKTKAEKGGATAAPSSGARKARKAA